MNIHVPNGRIVCKNEIPVNGKEKGKPHEFPLPIAINLLII